MLAAEVEYTLLTYVRWAAWLRSYKLYLQVVHYVTHHVMLG